MGALCVGQLDGQGFHPDGLVGEYRVEAEIEEVSADVVLLKGRSFQEVQNQSFLGGAFGAHGFIDEGVLVLGQPCIRRLGKCVITQAALSEVRLSESKSNWKSSSLKSALAKASASLPLILPDNMVLSSDMVSYLFRSQKVTCTVSPKLLPIRFRMSFRSPIIKQGVPIFTIWPS